MWIQLLFVYLTSHIIHLVVSLSRNQPELLVLKEDEEQQDALTINQDY